MSPENSNTKTKVGSVKIKSGIKDSSKEILKVEVFLVTTRTEANRQIQAKRDSLGGFLGAAKQPGIEGLKEAGDGFYREYVNGRIYWSPSTNAHEVHGAILGKWAALGFNNSLLGFPLGDETPTSDGEGRFNLFQNGVIYWSPATGAHEVHGAILSRWASLGFEQSYLGYPVSDESDLIGTNGKFSDFQRGQIAWTPAAGAAVSASSFIFTNGGGIRPKEVDPSGKPEIRRRVVASAHMDITDHETFGSNEHASADGQSEGFVTNSSTPSSFLRLIGKAGGEVRVELELNVSATTGGDARISGKTKLFEGTSTESDDLDGTTDIDFTVPRDGIITQAINVRNTDESGDFADIRLTVTNFAA